MYLFIKQKEENTLYCYIAFLWSCDEIWYYEYKVDNTTSHTVEIKAFDTDGECPVHNDTINLEPYSSYSVFKANGFFGDYQGLFNSGIIDSVTITFDNERIIIQSCEHKNGLACKFPRNLMDYNNKDDLVKTKTGRSQGNDEYTYTITEEDYNNAVPLVAD